MSRTLHSSYLTKPELAGVAEPLLADRLRAFGFGSLHVAEDVDWDGEPIIRMKADVARDVPILTSLQALDAVRQALIDLGEERVVFFDALPPRAEEEQDEEED